jgi:hypothetical protein
MVVIEGKLRTDNKWKGFPYSEDYKMESTLLDSKTPMFKEPNYHNKSEYSKVTNELNDHAPLWYDDINVLYVNNNFMNIIPNGYMSYNEKANSITRFFILFNIIMLIITKEVLYVYILVFGLFLMYFFLKNKHNMNLHLKEYFEDKIIRDNNITQSKDTVRFDGCGNICQKPTVDNPFMNVLVTDYNENPHRPIASDNQDEMVKEEIKNNFDNNLYKDVSDVFDKYNSQRQYYTTPNTLIPNDRESLTNWLYNSTNHASKDNYLVKNDISNFKDNPFPHDYFKN